MYSNEQMSQMVHDNSKELARLWESAKSAHRRIDENVKITDGIHDLAKNIAEMAAEVRLLTQKVDVSIGRIENGQKAQGERIGNIEKAFLALERSEKKLEEHEKRLGSIEKEPATKWKNLTWLVFAGVVTAIISFAIGKIF